VGTTSHGWATQISPDRAGHRALVCALVGRVGGQGRRLWRNPTLVERDARWGQPGRRTARSEPTPLSAPVDPPNGCDSDRSNAERDRPGDLSKPQAGARYVGRRDRPAGSWATSSLTAPAEYRIESGWHRKERLSSSSPARAVDRLIPATVASEPTLLIVAVGHPNEIDRRHCRLRLARPSRRQSRFAGCERRTNELTRLLRHRELVRQSHRPSATASPEHQSIVILRSSDVGFSGPRRTGQPGWQRVSGRDWVDARVSDPSVECTATRNSSS